MNPPTPPQTSAAGAPWSQSVENVLAALQTSTQGLSAAEAAKRLKEHGPNAIPEPAPDPLWLRFWRQLTGDAVVRLLLIGGIVCFVPGINDYLEGVAIMLMLAIMASFGVWQEGKASDAARSLRKTDNPTKSVFRDGKRLEVGVEDIVPGDVVYLPTGSVTPADGRVIAAVNAEKDSAKLTGESHPVEINTTPMSVATVINEQHNMVHRGDAILSGNVTMVVTATGSKTELGKIAERLATTEDAPTPLDEQLEELGDKMAQLFMIMAVVIIGAGAARELYTAFSTEGALTWGKGLEIFKGSFINAVALIIAAIPEGLPAVLTITLAIATKTMAARNAVVRRPKAVEGGGSMTVLLSDKTGTLTAGQMEVNHVWLDGRLLDASSIGDLKNNAIGVRALRVAKLCNNDANATETAILRWVEQSAYQPHAAETRATEHDFSQSLKRMSTVHAAEESGMYRILTKGAPEHVLALCTHQATTAHHDVPLDDDRRAVVEQNIRDLAGRGLRVIALADRMLADAHKLSREDAEDDLVFIGLIGIMDPPRADVAEAVKKLSAAGVQTVMITGDNALTAYYVAKMVGIVKGDPPLEEVVMTGTDLGNLQEPSPELLTRLHAVRVFARVTPEHKADIVKALQQDGYIVGMTGDGINDAIALQQSDVGFAMGNGTDVAREASDVVLMDSRFSTIPAAVEEGRNVLHRIRLYLSYILSGNGCELGAFIGAYALGVDIPLTALVLLVINFATDSFPALAMAFEAGEEDVMQRPPRRRGVPFINRAMWLHIGVQTVAATIIIMGVYYYALEQLGYFTLTGPAQSEALAIARSAAFMTYIWQKLYRAFTARSMTESLFKIGVFSNPWTPAAVAISLAIGLFFVYVPHVNAAVGMAALPAAWMGLTAAVGLVCPVAEEITKKFLRKRLDAA